MKVYKTNDSDVIPLLTIGNTTYMLTAEPGGEKWRSYSYDTKFVELVKRDNPSKSVDKLVTIDQKIIIKTLFTTEFK